MYESTRIRYLFFNLPYRTYVVVQAAVIVAWGVAAVLFYLFGRGSDLWLWDNAWWLCILVAALEIFESRLALARARRAHEDDGSGVA